MIRSRHLIFVIPLLLSIAPTHTALAQATSSVKCDDGSVVTLSTGTGGGACNQPPGVRLVECGDGAANQAIGGCDNGKARCGGITGAATCNITRTSNNGGTATDGIPQPVVSTGTINAEPITKSNTTEPNGGTKTEENPQPVATEAVSSITKSSNAEPNGSTKTEENPQPVATEAVSAESITKSSNAEPNGSTKTEENQQPVTTGTINAEPIAGSSATEPNGGTKTKGNPSTNRKPVTTRTKTPRKITNVKGGNNTGTNNNEQSSGGIKDLLDTLFR